MDEFSYLQFFEDDDKLLSQELDTIDLNFPNFNIEINENEVAIDPSTEVQHDETNANNTAVPVSSSTNKQNNGSFDQSRFPVVSDEVIEELKSGTINHNTCRSTKTWLFVLQKWCQSRSISEKIEKLSPQELDKILSKFYAEVKKQDGEDYEPDSLRVMQAAIERYLKENNYPLSIIRSREFHHSQQTLNAVAVSLRKQGKGKRPNKSKPLNGEEEEQLWQNGQLGSHNARAPTQTNFKILTEQMGLRGRQDHYDAYVEDFTVISHQDGSESVEFDENPTKTRSGGLRIHRRKTPQVMYSTDGGERDPICLFKRWLSKRPKGMEDNGPLYLSIINRPKSSDICIAKFEWAKTQLEM